MPSLDKIRVELRKLADPKRAMHSQGFFKTGPGEYGEGDSFLGIRVPQLRKLAKKYSRMTLNETKQLLKSTIHEERLLALFLLVGSYTRVDETGKKKIYNLYLNNTCYVNNWDLVDTSAPNIVGAFLVEKNRTPLQHLAKSSNLWERRIAILATFNFIKQGDYADTLKIARKLLADKEDLIQKAVGWMLREVGKRDLSTEEDFLKKYYKKMPRTMLRYAIERFPETKRKQYLQGKI